VKLLTLFKNALSSIKPPGLSALFLTILLAMVFVIRPGTATAQQVSIKQIELQTNGDVIISYDLLDDQADRKYSLYLYASTDNYIQPLEKVSGEVGVDLAVGGNKKITWHAKEELGEDFKGGVALELKGTTYIPFIALDGFDDYKVFKRGKEYDITWTGGRGDNILNFELYQGDEKIKVFEERPNVGNTVMVIPKDVKPGMYRFKISDSRNRDEVVFTTDFEVKRQIPLVATIGVGVIVGAGAAVLVQMLSNNEEPKIGDPPKPSGK
jgi:hypothetical protein